MYVIFCSCKIYAYLPSGLGSSTNTVLLFPRPALFLAATVIVTLGRLLFNPVT